MNGNASNKAYAHVLAPLALRGRTIRNRVLLTGHSVLYGVEGAFSDRHVGYYTERARAGVGLIITEQQAAHPAGRNYRAGLKAYDPALVPAWRKVTSAVQNEGVLIYAQLFCGGPQGQSTQYLDDWAPLQSPSGVRSTQFGEIPAVMSVADIRAVRDSFIASARNMEAGGFDGIEIHAAHSQLLGSFLSPAFNRRDDDYGGSTMKRCRIVIEILDAVRAAVRPQMHVGLRLGASEYLGPAGLNEEESLEQALLIAQTGFADFLDISAGGYFAKSVAVPPMASPLPTGFLQPFTKQLKHGLGSAVAVFSVGRVTTLAEAEHLVADGRADMVGMTRAHMADPFLIKKTLAGRKPTRCIGANVCAKRLVGNLPIACVLNPRMGRERERPAAPANKTAPRNLVVIGGGPAGLKAASTAAIAGHAVTVVEASPRLGGRLAMLADLPLRNRWASAIEDLVAEAEERGVRLRNGEAATLDLVRSLSPDLVLLATGSTWETDGTTPFRPGRAGIAAPEKGGPRRLGLDAAAAASAGVGNGVVILDEAFDSAAAALAIRFAEQGNRVTIITPSSSYADHLFLTYELPYFMRRIEDAHVRILTGVTLDSMGADGTVTAGSLFSEQTHTIEGVDTVVFAAGRRPRRDLEAPLTEAGFSARIIGDALAPRAIEAVISEGYSAGRALWRDAGWQAS